MEKKKIKNKKKLVITLIIILILVLVSTVIIRNIIANNELGKREYLATGNENSSLIANNIKKGITIGGITGTLESLDTSDATATPEDILEGKTAYVNGEKITGTMRPKVDGVTIPKGFYYVGGTKETGIVISDVKADENVYSKEKHADQANIPGDGLTGNQFVWVPVEEPTKFTRYKSYWEGSPEDISNHHEPSQEGYRYPDEVKEYNSMMQSVEENQGFYVARYEAGKEKINGVDTVVSKKNATVWNSIPWGNSMTDIGTEGAVAKAQGMYTNKETHNVTSTLIYGTQWDAIMLWIDPAYETSTCADDSFVKNSTGKGNCDEAENTNEWRGKVASCGASDSYRVNNIYDLAGNVLEWTMEANSTDFRVFRGGGYGSSGSGSPASFRRYVNPDNSFPYVRFPCRFIFVELNAKAAEQAIATEVVRKLET